MLVAGLPGAGKTTLLMAVAATRPGLTIRDSDDVREWLRARLPAVPYRYYRPAVHLAHQVRVFAAVLGAAGPVLVHDPATRPFTRRALLLAASVALRPAVFVWVDVAPSVALRGQHERGRTIRSGSFARHVVRADQLRDRLRADGGLSGWARTVLLDRDALRTGVQVDPVAA